MRYDMHAIFFGQKVGFAILSIIRTHKKAQETFIQSIKRNNTLKEFYCNKSDGHLKTHNFWILKTADLAIV